MKRKIYKNTFFYIVSLVLMLTFLACGQTAAPTAIPTATQPAPTDLPSATAVIPTATEKPTEVPTAEPTATVLVFNGMDVSASGTTFTIPTDLGNAAQDEDVPESKELPQLLPAHTLFILQGYPLQGKMFEPQIRILPVKEYAQMSENINQRINDLKNVLTAQRTTPADPIPFLPSLNASQVFHAQDKFLSFKNGTGIRFITQYDQAPMPVNNAEMFYAFQGITNDGAYYVSIIMPINLPYLPADGDMKTITPPEGIAVDWENFDKFPEYLNAIVDRLMQTDNTFTPALASLDALVQSLEAGGK